MIRHVVRQLAVQTLYQMEVGQMTKEEAIENIEWMVAGLKEEAIELVADTITHKEVMDIEEHFKLDDFYFRMVAGVLDHLEEIDQTITLNLEGWSLSRLNKVDKAIIRLATYELLYEKETDHKIIINEALELTKEFSETEDKKARNFNNKLLDNISKSRR